MLHAYALRLGQAEGMEIWRYIVHGQRSGNLRCLLPCHNSTRSPLA